MTPLRTRIRKTMAWALTLPESAVKRRAPLRRGTTSKQLRLSPHLRTRLGTRMALQAEAMKCISHCPHVDSCIGGDLFECISKHRMLVDKHPEEVQVFLRS